MGNIPNKNKIVTFYSYKGGTGRTQLLANIAAYLCYNVNKKVLMIDWDLEAPGLDFYFKFDRKIVKRGLIDVFGEYVLKANTPKLLSNHELPTFEDCIYEIDKTGKGGKLSLIPAANYNNNNYSHRIAAFDWFDFYDRLDGKYYIEFLKKYLNQLDYDAIFIDSRTGVSDYLGICNIQLPEKNVIVMAPSNQNIEGSLNILQRILENPYTKEVRKTPIILPILSRLDKSDDVLSNKIKAEFMKSFGEIIKNTFYVNKLDAFIESTTLFYVRDLAYQEKLVFSSKENKISGVGSIESIFANIAEKLKIVENLASFDYINVKKIIKDANNSTIYIIDGKSVSVPRHLGSFPLISNNFFGREEELQEMHHLLFQGENLLLVNGEGGIGKTTLAAKYYQRYDNDYLHLAWVFAEQNLTDALLMLAGQLGITFPPEMEGKERLALQLQTMRKLPKPCLLVIDNANELTALETHYQALRTLSNFHILLTSRISEFEKITHLKIEGLPPEKALALFKSHYDKHNPAEDALFYAIHTAVGANTLLLELIAKNLKANNALKLQYSLADLAADIQQGLLNMKHDKAVLTDWYKGGKASVKDIFLTLYDLSGLSAQERALLSVFAVLPAEAIPFDVIESLLTDKENLADTLLSLAQKGWLDYTAATATFKISPVIQEISKSKNAASLLTDTDSLIISLADKLDYETGTGHFINASYEEAAVFTRYAMSVVNSITDLRYRSLSAAETTDTANYKIGVLCERIGEYYKTTGNLPQAFFYYEKKVEIDKELCLNYPENAAYKNGLAIAYSKLGNTHTSLGNLEKALAFYEELARLFKELYETYPANVSFKYGLQISYEKLGDTHTNLGNLEKALAFYEEEHLLLNELYEAYPANVSFKNGLAVSYAKLGNTHTSLGNLEKALAFYEDYKQLTKELYEAYPANVSFKNNLAIAYEKLGNTHTSLGNLEKALAFYEDETDLFKELYEGYPANVSFKNGLAISYSKLGETHTSLGNLEKALAFYEERSRLGKELYEAYPANVSFKNGLALSYQWLGWFFQNKMNDLQKAKAYYKLSEILLEELIKAAPLYVGFQKNLEWVQNVLKGL